MKLGDIVIYNNKEYIINGVLASLGEPLYSLRDMKSGKMLPDFLPAEELTKVKSLATGGNIANQLIPYSTKPKYAKGKTKKDFDKLDRTYSFEEDGTPSPVTFMIDSNKSYDEAKNLYAETSKKHKATLAYAINKDGRYDNMNHLEDFKPERNKNE